MERVKHFKITSERWDLVNKTIQQIKTTLLEYRFFRDSQKQSSAVRGVARREIRYLELDNRLRIIDDWIQLEIDLGEDPGDLLPGLYAELKQDFYLFQPGRAGEIPAILEQGFSLIIGRKVALDLEFRETPLLVNSIIKQGEERVVLEIPVKLPAGAFIPKGFQGCIRLNQERRPGPVEGEIAGIITGRTADGYLKEVDLKQNVSILVKLPVLNGSQSLRILGQIRDCIWKPGSISEEWRLALKVDLYWYLTELKSLICKEWISGSSSKAHKIKSLVLSEERISDFAREISLDLPEGTAIAEAVLEKVDYETKITKKGLLLTANLAWGIFFINPSGLEEYRESRVQIDELLPYKLPDQTITKETTYITELIIEPLRQRVAEKAINVDLQCHCILRAYDKKTTVIIEETAAKEGILADVIFGVRKFTLLGEVVLNLRDRPAGIEQFKSRLVDIQALVKEGWLNVSGCLELAITYINQIQALREDLFKTFFQESYLWEQLTLSTPVDLQGELAYDGVSLIGDQISYKYLLNISAQAHQEKAIQVSTAGCQRPAEGGTAEVLSGETTSAPSGIKLLIQGEIPLTQGRLKKIIESRLRISDFSYRDSLNAILIRGNLTGEVDFLDGERYLKTVKIELPFWRFINNSPDLTLDRRRLIPEIAGCSYTPVKILPWGKGSLKIDLNLELRPVSSP
ncbi:MAG: hypothetical protein ACM3X9_11740 [Bacillota bacterium]